MAKVIAALIRHGEYHQLPATPSAHQPFPLTEQGVAQSKEAAIMLLQMLSEHGWQRHPIIDSSNLLRGWQTAEIIAQALGLQQQQTLKVEGFDNLAERSVGSAANLTISQIEEIVNQDSRFPALPKNWKSDSHFCLPLQGAESLMEAGKRVAQHLQQRVEKLATELEQDTLQIFVGHGAAFRHAAHHLGILQFEQIAKLSMYHASPVCLAFDEDGSWRHLCGNWKVRKPKDTFLD